MCNDKFRGITNNGALDREALMAAQSDDPLPHYVRELKKDQDKKQTFFKPLHELEKSQLIRLLQNYQEAIVGIEEVCNNYCCGQRETPENKFVFDLIENIRNVIEKEIRQP